MPLDDHSYTQFSVWSIQWWQNVAKSKRCSTKLVVQLLSDPETLYWKRYFLDSVELHWDDRTNDKKNNNFASIVKRSSNNWNNRGFSDWILQSTRRRFIKESPYELNTVMRSGSKRSNHKIARFPERSTRQKKPVKGHKPSVRLELKSYLIIIAVYVTRDCLLVKCFCYELMRFLLKFFCCFNLFLFFTAKKWGGGGGSPPAPSSTRSLLFMVNYLLVAYSFLCQRAK